MKIRRYISFALLIGCVASSPLFSKEEKAKEKNAKKPDENSAHLTVLPEDPKMEAPKSYAEALESLSPATPPRPMSRKLATGDNTADLQYYKDLDRKLGIDLGMMLPMGDFQSDFSSAAALGIHYTWAAMPPFSFCLSTFRASTHHKNGPASGKLTVNSIAFGAIGSFPTGRLIPFIRLEGALFFNDVSFDANRVFTSGNDTFITTVGANFGVGWDFVVGRELSLGLDATYHYAIPKKAVLSTGTMYDLGSSYATASFRLNF